ncbi:MAG: hypothetical protein ACRD2X_15895 [Vicinamibacteraceae bacterium]
MCRYLVWSCSWTIAAGLFLGTAEPRRSRATASQQAAESDLDAVIAIGERVLEEVNEAKRTATSKTLRTLGRKRADELWAYRERYPRTEIADRATADALHVLVHADLTDEAFARAATLRPDDGAWNATIEHLMEGALDTGLFESLIDLAKALIRSVADVDLRSHVQYVLGQAYREQGRPDLAVLAFDEIAANQPRWGERAARELVELRSLRAGQPAPAFDVLTTTGDDLTLASLRGNAVLLNFWSPT